MPSGRWWRLPGERGRRLPRWRRQRRLPGRAAAASPTAALVGTPPLVHSLRVKLPDADGAAGLRGRASSARAGGGGVGRRGSGSQRGVHERESKGGAAARRLPLVYPVAEAPHAARRQRRCVAALQQAAVGGSGPSRPPRTWQHSSGSGSFGLGPAAAAAPGAAAGSPPPPPLGVCASPPPPPSEAPPAPPLAALEAAPRRGHARERAADARMRRMAEKTSNTHTRTLHTRHTTRKLPLRSLARDERDARAHPRPIISATRLLPGAPGGVPGRCGSGGGLAGGGLAGGGGPPPVGLWRRPTGPPLCAACLQGGRTEWGARACVTGPPRGRGCVKQLSAPPPRSSTVDYRTVDQKGGRWAAASMSGKTNAASAEGVVSSTQLQCGNPSKDPVAPREKCARLVCEVVRAGKGACR